MGRGFSGRGGFSRGGGGSRSSGGRSAGGQGNNAGRSRSSGGQSSRPKGQVRNGKVVQYAVQTQSGKTTYIGSTNNPTRRAAQHQQNGKMGTGDRLVVQSRPISRAKAERLESGRLHGHRQENGRNPRHNATRDGRYQPRLF